MVEPRPIDYNRPMNPHRVPQSESLDHVLWIGGAAAAGKTTLSRRLSDEFGFTRWAGDGRWIEHWQSVTPERYPIASRIGSTLRSGGSFDWFFGCPGKEIADNYIEMARVEFADAVAELREFPADVPIVVDAFLGIPQLIFQVAKPARAIFLTCTDDFARTQWKHRTTPGSTGFLPLLKQQLDTCTEPQSAVSNFIEANIRLSRFVAEDCRRHGAVHLITAGRVDADLAYVEVKRHFGLLEEPASGHVP